MAEDTREGRYLLEARDVGLRYRLEGSPDSGPRRFGIGRRPKRDHWALRDVSFGLAEGEVLGLIGSNGAGKSTLCRLVAGVLRPDEGCVTVRGSVAPLLALGTGLEKDLTGRQNVRLCGALMGLDDARVDDLEPRILEFAELGEFLDQPVRTYSSGMRARLAFAIATSVEPDLLVLDEILGVGDAAFRRKSRAAIRAMIDRSRGVVLVSHSTRMILKVCTTALWLHRGKIREHGPVREVVRSYERWAARHSDSLDDPAGAEIEEPGSADVTRS